MATLLRPRPPSDLHANIPTPFPAHLLNDHLLDELAAEPVDYDDNIHTCVAAVQHSCLITLANILSLHDSGTLTVSCLIHALRARDGHQQPRDLPLGELAQLRELVDAIVPSLHSQDAHLAQAIVALLLDLQQLPASPAHDPSHLTPPTSASPHATIASLQRRLSSLQLSPSTSSASRHTSAESVQTALFWARIDDQLDSVVSLCKARASDMTSRQFNNDHRPSFDDTLPPEYDAEYLYEHPPSYVADDHLYQERPSDEKRLAEQYPPEKLLSRASTEHSVSSNSLDLDTITHAIERLYVVAPQLANQRVELRREKITQMESAKAGKGKACTLADTDDPELDKMLDLLGKASAREIPDQSVVIDPRRTGREKCAADIEEQVGRHFFVDNQLS